MLLRKLQLTNFKNIESATLAFSPKINCFLGKNGMGKSNLLDAIYMLSYSRSFSGLGDNAVIRRGEEFAILRGEYLRRGMDELLESALRPGRRKSLKRSGKEYRRLADHIGAFPAVLVSPADMELVSGEPAERRRFMDQLASQSEAGYLDALLRYNHAMQQRNSLLKGSSIPDSGLLDAIEMQMEMAAAKIMDSRLKVVEALAGPFLHTYRQIAGTDEIPTLRYVSAVSADTLAELWRSRRERDRLTGFTGAGPHRDDLEFLLMGAPVRRVASQGQSKTFTTSLRFAQYAMLRNKLGLNPLLLLDDIFDKLDSDRVQKIISTVAAGDFGQIFITDTNRAHLDETIASASTADARLWNVENGTFTAITRSSL